MAETNPFTERLREPLNETTRRSRRNLLAASVVGVVITKVGLVPSKISAFGIEFTQANQNSLLLLLSLTIIYFLVAFIVYVSSELVAWQMAFRSEELKSLKEQAEYDFDIDSRHERLIHERAQRTYSMAKPTFYLRIFTEIGIPLILGIYSAFILMSTQIDSDKENIHNSATGYNYMVMEYSKHNDFTKSS